MTWPDHFPAKCPPGDVVDAAGEVYRFVDSNPPDEGDFLSHVELNPEQKWSTALHCDACGLSVFTDRDEALRVGRLLPPLIDKLPAVGTLQAAFGKMKPTPNLKNKIESHVTWWKDAAAEPWHDFAVLEVAGG